MRTSFPRKRDGNQGDRILDRSGKESMKGRGRRAHWGKCSFFWTENLKSLIGRGRVRWILAGSRPCGWVKVGKEARSDGKPQALRGPRA